MSKPDQPDAQSRRGFLTGAAGVAIGAGVLGAAGTAAAAQSPSTTVPSIHPPVHTPLPAHPHHNRNRFENAPGGRMTIRLADGPVTLDIDNIEPLGVAAEAKAGSPLWRDAFRVNLKGPKGTDIPQGTHKVSIGNKSFDLFVVPVMSTGGHRRFEAIIHRAYHRSAHA
ncbi:MAG: hypothetical protein WCO40_04845 [Thermoleophilia bacterium]